MSGRLASLFLVSASAKVYFSETFTDGWEDRWVLSKGTETQKLGRWAVATGKYFRDEAEDRGLQTAETMKHYGIAAGFESFGNEGKELIIQYQAKYEKDLSCGGGYLKVGPKVADLTTFGEDTPYNIMFGPDQCNADKRTHLIFSHKGDNFLKKDNLPFKQEGEGVSHLYRLVVRPDSTVLVEVDQERLYEGSLKVDWDILPAAEISDPDDKKPSDWVEDSMMNDPEDKKHADWVDEERIVDPDSARPSEWDDEEDGEWEPPKIENPTFKGAWAAKKIANPEYKGAWEARAIPNPDFKDDLDLYKYPDFGFVGFDVWQVKGGTIFDNIIVTDSATEADEFAAKWKKLSEHEAAERKKEDERLAAAFEKSREARSKRAAELKAKDEAKAAADKAAGGGGEDATAEGADGEVGDDDKVEL